MKYPDRFAAAVVVAVAATSAQAQQEFVEAFSGAWYVFDPGSQSGNDPCRIDLDGAETMPMPARNAGCTGLAAQISAWRIEDGQIFLEGASNAALASLGGNQTRITGRTSDGQSTLILDRATGTGAGLTEAMRRHGCYFAGFDASCASQADLAPPPRNGSRVMAIADLNVRAQPRRDAGVLGVVAQGTDVEVEVCLQAADGYWCRAMFGEEPGWMAKFALRQDEWPVVTFVQSSAPDS